MQNVSKNEPKKMLYIESLRGISCLIVLISHIISTSQEFGKYASGCGKIGVWLFMILSGYLLIKRYIVNELKFFKLIEIPKYYLKKVIRLYPMYIIAIVLAVFLEIISVENIKNHILLKEAWGHFWYMPVIIKFYFVAPLFLILFSVLRKKFIDKAPIIYMLTITIIGIIFCICFPFTKYIENSISLYWYIPVFLIGMIIACIENYIPTTSSKFNKICLALLILAIAMIIIVTPLFRQILFGATPSGYLQNKYIYMSLCWGVIMYGIGNVAKLKIFFDRITILQKLGSISFEIYLIHYIILIKLGAYNISFWVKAVVTVIASIVISIVLHFIDDKINYISKKLIK